MIGNLPLLAFVSNALFTLGHIITLPSTLSKYFKTQKKVEKLAQKIHDSEGTYDTEFLRKNDITQLRLDKERAKVVLADQQESAAYSVSAISFTVFTSVAIGVGLLPVTGGISLALGVGFSILSLAKFLSHRKRQAELAKTPQEEVELTSVKVYDDPPSKPSLDEDSPELDS